MSPICFDTMSRVTGKPYWVYVLWSVGLRRFYIGISDNPEHRLRQHNESGRGWTARGRPWMIVHTEFFPDYRTARSRESNFLDCNARPSRFQPDRNISFSPVSAGECFKPWFLDILRIPCKY